VWPRGWVEVKLYSSITTALEGGEWSAACPGCTLPPGKTQYPFYRRLGGPQGQSGHTENLAPTMIRSQTIQPVVSRYEDWATRSTGYGIPIKTAASVLLYMCNNFRTTEQSFMGLIFQSFINSYLHICVLVKISKNNWLDMKNHTCFCAHFKCK